MGIVRKALLIGTAGLSGLVLKDEEDKSAKVSRSAKAARPAKTTVAAKKAATQKARQKRPRQSPAKISTATARKKARTAPSATASTSKQPVSSASAAAMAPAREGTLGELERLADMHSQAVLTDREFVAAKAKILGTDIERDTPAATFPAVEANIAASRRIEDLAAQDLRTSGLGGGFAP